MTLESTALTRQRLHSKYHHGSNDCTPVPPGVITDGEPEISRASETEAHGHAVDENHDDAKFVCPGI